MGPSGSGKSTLTKLIQRLYVPESGRVSVDVGDRETIPVESRAGDAESPVDPPSVAALEAESVPFEPLQVPGLPSRPRAVLVGVVVLCVLVLSAAVLGVLVLLRR